MTSPINELRGITEAVAAELKQLGIHNSDQLSESTGTPAQRKELASKAGISAQEVLALANRADLARVKGIGGAYSDLLEKGGVDTVKELAMRRPDNLHEKIVAVNEEHGYVKVPPALSMVKSWVTEAKSLPRALEY
jgi:predicted flap endonuclease-1-like 5' DNA nuclease